jgi:hypothetical protein
MPRLLTAISLIGAGYGASRLLRAGDRRPRAAQSWSAPKPPSPEADAAVMAADSVQALDPRFSRYMLGNTHVERLQTGARCMEGPAWCGDLGILVFSDIPNNRLLKYDEQSGQVSILRQPSDYANGTTRDQQGRLITCTQDARSIVQIEHDGRLTRRLRTAASFHGHGVTSLGCLICGAGHTAEGGVPSVKRLFTLRQTLRGWRRGGNRPLHGSGVGPDGYVSPALHAHHASLRPALDIDQRSSKAPGL